MCGSSKTLLPENFWDILYPVALLSETRFAAFMNTKQKLMFAIHSSGVKSKREDRLELVSCGLLMTFSNPLSGNKHTIIISAYASTTTGLCEVKGNDIDKLTIHGDFNATVIIRALLIVMSIGRTIHLQRRNR